MRKKGKEKLEDSAIADSVLCKLFNADQFLAALRRARRNESQICECIDDYR